MTETVNFNYYNTLTTKVDDKKYEFRGKANAPNLNIVTGSHVNSYVSANMYIRDGKLLVEHMPSTNSDIKVYTMFYLRTDDSVGQTDIDNLMSLSPGESTDVTLNKLLKSASKDYTVEKDKNGKMVGVQYNEPIMIKTKLKIVEGLSCSSPTLKSEIDKMIGDAVGGLRGELLKLLTDHEGTPHGGDGGGGGGGGGSNPSNNPVDFTCDAFPEYKNGKLVEGDAKYVSIPITKDMTESQANSKLMIIVLANLLMLTAVIVTFFFIIPPIYIGLLRSFAKNVVGMAKSMPLVRMHAFEGLFSCIIITISTILLIYKDKVDINIPTGMLVIWLILVFMVSATKNNMTRAAFPGESDVILKAYYGDLTKKTMVKGVEKVLNEFGTEPSRISAILYHMFFFLPFYFPLAFAIEHLSKKSTMPGPAVPSTGICPPPYFIWNTL